MTAIRTRALCGALVLALISGSANAQSLTTIAIGESIAESGGTKVDLYRFGAQAGSAIRISLTSQGQAALVLYTPSGEEMLSSRGSAIITLDAIAPLDDVYTFSVLREAHTSPYNLKIESKEPDVFFADFAKYVGYQTVRKSGEKHKQCWVDPGHKVRMIQPNFVTEIAIGREGRFYHKDIKGGHDFPYESQRVYTAKEVIDTYTAPDGSTHVIRFPLDRESDGDPSLTFASYLCP